MATIEGVTLDNLTEIEKTDLVPATMEEVVKYFDTIPANNKRFRGRDISKRATPGNPTNEDTRVVFAFLRMIRNAIFTGEWADPHTLEVEGATDHEKIYVKDVRVSGSVYGGGADFYLAGHMDGNTVHDGHAVFDFGNQSIDGQKTFSQGPYGTTSAVSGNSVNLANGVVFTKTISANTTLTFTGVPSGKAATFNLILTNGGAYDITWPSSVKWEGGEAPTLTESGVDVLTFLTPNGGTTWYGTLAIGGAA